MVKCNHKSQIKRERKREKKERERECPFKKKLDDISPKERVSWIAFHLFSS